MSNEEGLRFYSQKKDKISETNTHNRTLGEFNTQEEQWINYLMSFCEYLAEQQRRIVKYQKLLRSIKNRKL